MANPDWAWRGKEGTAASGTKKMIRNTPAMKFEQNKADLAGSLEDV
jgi:hypothetical protein